MRISIAQGPGQNLVNNLDSDGNLPVFASLITDYVGDMEVVETVDVDSSATDTLTLVGPASDGIKVVTIQAIPTSHSSGAKTSDVRVIYVGFTGTPFNDVDTASLRRTVEMGTERTFVFSDDVLPTGITLKGDAGVGTTTNVVVAEVTYV